MPGFKSYRDLRVWQDAMALAESCYQITLSFPKEEMYGLTSQTRRSAVSIAANIAEGHGRETTGAFVQFLRNAQGSLKELETHLLLACRVRCASAAEVEPILTKCGELGRMLRSLIRSLQRKNSGTEE
ncbi:four helix bundle protein [Rhizobiales bacterium GAS191]|nr:four helix bundle protein [Rhizobiales bacterium GAS113]SEC01237.1 four helix bundle protein [Rhizobiales bacterium GAS188]SED21205.1 four helix bundle protein [Rhizobiales bacterium GAS191]